MQTIHQAYTMQLPIIELKGEPTLSSRRSNTSHTISFLKKLFAWGYDQPTRGTIWSYQNTSGREKQLLGNKMIPNRRVSCQLPELLPLSIVRILNVYKGPRGLFFWKRNIIGNLPSEADPTSKYSASTVTTARSLSQLSHSPDTDFVQ